MESAFQSFLSALKNRSTSAAIGTYVLFWTLFHSQGIFTGLVTDQELIFQKYGLLKNEYVYDTFFRYHLDNKLFGVPFDLNFLCSYIFPFALTILFIWFLPKYFLIHAYTKEQEYKTDRKRVRYKEEQKVLQFEKNTAVKRTETIDAQIELTQKENLAKDVDPEIIWRKDFKEFQDDPYYSGFNRIINSVYEYEGNFKSYYDSRKSRTINPGISPSELAAADSNELIIINNKNQTIELTPKGKYFVKMFSLNNKIVKG